MQLLHQYATRPHDAAYTEFAPVLAELAARRDAATTVSVTMDDLHVTSTDDSLMLHGSTMNNWAFRQLCNITRTPSDVITSLLPSTAMTVLNERLALSRKGDVSLLVDDKNTLRAITSTRYSRVWDYTMMDSLAHAVSGTAVRPFKLFAGERDSFACLINDKTPVYDQGADKLFRGMFVWNSEVGARSFGIARFLFRSICSNCIVSGMKMDALLRTRHVGDMERIAERIPAFVSWCELPAQNEGELITAAKTRILGAEPADVVAALAIRYNVSQSDGARIVEYAQVDERESRAYGDPSAQWNTVWGVMQGVTRYSQTLPYANERVTLDLIGTKLFALN